MEEAPPLPGPQPSAELPRAGRALVAATGALALAVAVALLAQIDGASDGWLELALLFPLVVAAQLTGVPTRRGYLMLTATPLVALAVLADPEVAVLAAVGAAVTRIREPLRWHHVSFNVSTEALALAAASTAAHAVAGSGSFAAAGLAAASAYAVVGNGLLAAIGHAVGSLPRGEVGAFVAEVVLPEAALAAHGVVVAWLWRTNAALVPLALLPLPLAFRALRVPRLEEEARLDPKTGLLNARSFRQELRAELTRARRFGRPLALVLADLDFLREVNNTHGHLAGDAVIVGIADALRSELRRLDVAARFGGEEFAVLLPESTAAQAAEIAERLRRAVASRRFESGGTALRATLSLGVAAFPEDAHGADELIGRADDALYAAKEAGRNRVRRARRPRARVLP